jgi:hypothetical protein
MDDRASEQLERMERALQKIVDWSNAYPLRVFPEPDETYYTQAAWVLQANGMSLDRLSAAAMRHVVVEVAKIAREALAGEMI